MGRVLRQAAGEGLESRPEVIHWCDNQGVVAAWNRRDLIKAGAQRGGPAAAGRVELAELRESWGGGRNRWGMELVAAHPERDADREATSWSDAERENVRADAAAEAAHTSEVAFDWDESCMLRAGGGMWALADTTILEAPVPRHAWQRRSRELGIEYARERLKQEGLERQGWATAIWAGVKERDWGVTNFRTRLW